MWIPPTKHTCTQQWMVGKAFLVIAVSELALIVGMIANAGVAWIPMTLAIDNQYLLFGYQYLWKRGVCPTFIIPSRELQL